MQPVTWWSNRILREMVLSNVAVMSWLSPASASGTVIVLIYPVHWFVTRALNSFHLFFHVYISHPFPQVSRKHSNPFSVNWKPTLTKNMQPKLTIDWLIDWFPWLAKQLRYLPVFLPLIKLIIEVFLMTFSHKTAAERFFRSFGAEVSSSWDV